MTTIKKWQLLTFLLVNLVAFNACSNTPAENKQVLVINDIPQKTKTKKVQLTDSGISPLQSKLDNAKKAGKAVFIVVTEAGTTDVGKATIIATEANAIYKNAVVLQLNRDDQANAELVAEWRLAGAPLPLILVISTKGMPTGGYLLEQATAENIAALVPSPKLETVYEAIGDSKYAIVAFTKKSFPERAEVLSECNKAISLLNNEAVLIEVDMEDSKEIGFMNQLRIDPLITDSSVTLIINKQGQVAGTSSSVPDAVKLVTAANAPVKSGCGPGCGPAGCDK